MSRITEELLRKRSEHNECMLTTLEEVMIYLGRFRCISNSWSR